MWNTTNEVFRLTDVIILRRDQRTTSHRVFDCNAGNNSSNMLLETFHTLHRHRADNVNRHHHHYHHHHQHHVDMTNARTKRDVRAQRHLQDNSHLTSVFYDDRGRSRRTARVNVTQWLSKSKWLILSLWFAFLLVFTILLTVQSAPMTLEERWNVPPKWVNPCGLTDEIEPNFDGSDIEIQLKDDQLLQQIVVQASVAKGHTELFREKYVRDVFKRNMDELHSMWKHNRYEWLPEIPKNLGEYISAEHLQSLTLDEALLDTYEYLQKFAVGLEQIVWDQEDHQLKYRNEFKLTEYKLRAVLCEIQVALIERGITQRPDVTRDIMARSLRNIDSETYRDLRDWMIFRDYMNALEYVVQVFEYLRTHSVHQQHKS